MELGTWGWPGVILENLKIQGFVVGFSKYDGSVKLKDFLRFHLQRISWEWFAQLLKRNISNMNLFGPQTLRSVSESAGSWLSTESSTRQAACEQLQKAWGGEELTQVKT